MVEWAGFWWGGIYGPGIFIHENCYWCCQRLLKVSEDLNYCPYCGRYQPRGKWWI